MVVNLSGDRAIRDAAESAMHAFARCLLTDAEVIR